LRNLGGDLGGTVKGFRQEMQAAKAPASLNGEAK
jgi:Sec-independent protein translocase protein TatA